MNCQIELTYVKLGDKKQVKMPVTKRFYVCCETSFMVCNIIDRSV